MISPWGQPDSVRDYQENHVFSEPGYFDGLTGWSPELLGLNTDLPLLWAGGWTVVSQSLFKPNVWWFHVALHAEISHVGCHIHVSEAFCEGNVDMDINAGARKGLTLRTISDVNEAQGSSLSPAGTSNNWVSRCMPALLRTCNPQQCCGAFCIGKI